MKNNGVTKEFYISQSGIKVSFIKFIFGGGFSPIFFFSGIKAPPKKKKKAPTKKFFFSSPPPPPRPLPKKKQKGVFFFFYHTPHNPPENKFFFLSPSPLPPPMAGTSEEYHPNIVSLLSRLWPETALPLTATHHPYASSPYALPHDTRSHTN